MEFHGVEVGKQFKRMRELVPEAYRSFLELQQRNGIIAVHPGGTTDVQRISMARRIGIGRPAREAAGTVH